MNLKNQNHQKFNKKGKKIAKNALKNQKRERKWKI